MPERARIGIGIVAIAAAVAAVVWALSAGGGRPTTSHEHGHEHGAASEPGSAEAAGSVADPAPASQEQIADLAARLARALDGGMRPSEPVIPEGQTARDPSGAPRPPAPPAPPRPQVRLDHPMTAGEQMDYAGRLHDWIVIRRDDLRQRLAQLESEGQGQSDQANRIRWEIRRLEETEPTARRQVEELAERARREAPREPPGEAPADPERESPPPPETP